MSVTIRLTRRGARRLPFYRVIATDRRSRRDGRFIEQLGVYDPLRQPPEFRIDAERLAYWLGKGARASATVAQLVRRQKNAGKAAAAPPAGA